ncbi:hypothetical protein Slala05_78110 [Streptomyces lavendulae subsp. lavendulae]|nr:hypothetical protein Slala05_78110 [Streptomyces lavendulae subsp. lavendulae]
MHEMRLGPSSAVPDGLCWHITERRTPLSLCGDPIPPIGPAQSDQESRCCEPCLTIYRTHLQEQQHTRNTEPKTKGTARHN